MKDRNEAVRAFLVAIVTALITIVGVAISQIEGPVSERWASIIGFAIIVLASMSLLVLIGSSFVLQYVRAAQEIRSDEILRDSVPTLIRFRSRSDTFTIEPSGHISLRWQFEIDKGLRQGWKLFEFPIITDDRGFGEDEDEDESAPAPTFSLKVQSVAVDGKDMTRSSVLQFEERRSLVATKRHLDYSRLSIPVRLEEGKSRAKLDIKLIFEKKVTKAGELEFVVVDIPYVTEKLQVAVRHADARCSIVPPVNTLGEVDDRPILASFAMMGFTDSWETELEADNLVAESGMLIWTTNAPKLGYRYRIKFRVINNAPTEIIDVAEEVVPERQPVKLPAQVFSL